MATFLHFISSFCRYQCLFFYTPFKNAFKCTMWSVTSTIIIIWCAAVYKYNCNIICIIVVIQTCYNNGDDNNNNNNNNNNVPTLA